MKNIPVKAALVLLVAAGSILPVYGQRGGDDRGRDRENRGPARVERGQGRAERPGRVERGREQDHRRDGDFRRFQSHDWRNDHRSWTQRGGYSGYVIPQNRFRGSFGRGHYFRMGRPTFYQGQPRFAYNGYSFVVADPWPVAWGANWYDSDEVYVDYVNDGYYLYNRQHPGIGLSLSIHF